MHMDVIEFDLDRWATKGEATVARKLIRIILDKGYAISVFDGEEWVVKVSTDRKAIIRAVGSTGEDLIRIREFDKHVGSFWLVYGNADDGSELIADHTDNELCNEIWSELFPD
jgi:hypothetical protein